MAFRRLKLMTASPASLFYSKTFADVSFRSFGLLRHRHSPLQYHCALRRQVVLPSRWCFHPGALSIARNSLGNEDQQNVTNLDMLKSMKGYVWPHDNPVVKRRVVVSLGLLVGAKCLNTSVPILFKDVIDLLGRATPDNLGVAQETFDSLPIVFQQGGTSIKLHHVQ